MKKALKRSLSLLLAITIISGSAYVGLSEVDFDSVFAIEAKAANVDDLTFTLNEDGKSYSVTECDKEARGDIVIPDVYNNSPVTDIGLNAFWLCSYITSITIPDSVKSISKDSFYSCASFTAINVDENNAYYTSVDGVLFNKNMTELIRYPAGKQQTSYSIFDGVTSIGDSAFYGCNSLVSIKIPDTVRNIGNNAFSACTSLTSITIPDSVTTIGSCAFSVCSSLISIAIPYGITSIETSTFSHCRSLTSITIPDSVTTIASGAFEDCISLSSITIPNSVTSMGRQAFYDCSTLAAINVDENNAYYTSVDGVLFNKNMTELIRYPAGKQQSVYAIFDGVKSIGDYAFKGCTRVSSVLIPDSITDIGEESFYGCISLSSLSIPDSVISIGAWAFRECKSLTSIAIPDSVTSINSCAFCDCTSLATVTIPDSVTSICDSAFSRCTNLTSITIPDSVTSIGHFTFSECTNLETIAIPDSVTSIGDSAFEGCTNLATVTIPDSVTSIGDSAFEGCTSLAIVTIPNSVTSIGHSAFFGCTSLTTVTIPDSVTSIFFSTFSACTSLTSITIPNGVTSIGDCAFEYCTNLTSITIPESVTSIGYKAFYNTGYYNNLSNWQYDVLYIGVHLIEAKTPLSGSYIIIDGTKTIADYAFYNHTNLTSITISNSVTSIGNGAFYYCTGLRIVNCTDCIFDFSSKKIGLNNESLLGAAWLYTDHSPSDWMIDKTESCGNDGSKHKECLKCNKTIEIQSIPATKKHTPSNWIINKQPTASVLGSKHKECTECGEILETATIPLLDLATPKATSSNDVGGIKVYWNKVNGAVKYNVYRRVGGSNSWVLVGTTTGTLLIDKGVSHGKYYAYSVRAYNSQGSYSAYNKNMTYTTKCVTPPKLTSLVNDTNGLKLTWGVVSGASYRVYRRGAGSTSWTYLGTTNSTTFTDSKASSGAYWRYTVRAVSSGYYSGFDTNGLYSMRLANPYSIKASQVQGGVNVTWAKINGATGYRVYRRGVGQNAWTYLGAATTNSFKDTTIAYGENYYRYTVRATRGNIYSGFYTDGAVVKASKVRATFSSEIGAVNGTVYSARHIGHKKDSDGTWGKTANSKIPVLPVYKPNKNLLVASFCYYDGYIYYTLSQDCSGGFDVWLYRCNLDFTNTKLLAFSDGSDDDWENDFDRYFYIYENKLYLGWSNSSETFCINLSTLNMTKEKSVDFYSIYNVDKNNVSEFGQLEIYNDNVFYSDDFGEANIYLIKNSKRQLIMQKAELDGGYVNGCIYYSRYNYNNGNGQLWRKNLSTGKTEFLDEKPTAGGGGLYFNW